MKNSSVNMKTGLGLTLVLIPTVLALLSFGKAWTTMALQYNEAISCDGMPNSPTPKVLQGAITKDAEYTKFYISNSEGETLVYDCRRCDLNKQLKQSLNQQAVATFCMDQLVSLDIGGRRFFTKDMSLRPLLIAGATFTGCTALIFVLFAYGSRKFSLRREPKGIENQ